MTRSSNHPEADSTPADFGPPDRLHYKNYKLMTPEEEEAFWERIRLEDAQTDLY